MPVKITTAPSSDMEIGAVTGPAPSLTLSPKSSARLPSQRYKTRKTVIEQNATVDALTLRDQLAAGTLDVTGMVCLPSQRDPTSWWRTNQPNLAIVCTVIWGILIVLTTYKITNDLTTVAIWLSTSVNLIQKAIAFRNFPHDFPEAFAEAFAMLGPEDVAFVKKIMCWREPVLRFTSTNRTVHPKRSLAFQTFLTLGVISGWTLPYLWLRADWYVLLPWVALNWAANSTVGAYAWHMALCMTTTMWLPHARATAAQVAALARQLSSDEEADQMCHAALSNDVHVRDAYLDGLAERYAMLCKRVDKVTTIWKDYFCIAEFIIPCTLVVLLVSTWSNIARFMKDGDQARIVLFVNSGSLIHTVLLLFVEVFLVGASITSHGKDVAKALRDLSLHLPSATSDHFVAVLDRLQAHAGAHPPAFRPHGFTINIGIAVAALNIIVTVGVACFVERTLEGLPM